MTQFKAHETIHVLYLSVVSHEIILRHSFWDPLCPCPYLLCLQHSNRYKHPWDQFRMGYVILRFMIPGNLLGHIIYVATCLWRCARHCEEFQW